MEHITSTELKNNLGRIIEDVKQGHSFEITKNGRPVGRFVPVSQRKRKMSPQEALDFLINFRPSVGISREEIKEYIEDGRRF